MSQTPPAEKENAGLCSHGVSTDPWSYCPICHAESAARHDFRPWTVLPGWRAPGCACGVIRSAGKPTESEEAMRLWHEAHLKSVGRPTSSGAPS